MANASNKSKNSPDEEEDDEVGEEEYEIEKIIKAQKGHFEPGRWAFMVKWKNYPEEENSWVDEPDFFAKDMIQKYWDDNPDIPGNPLKLKKSRQSTNSKADRPRKSAAAEAARSGDDQPKERRKAKKVSEEPAMDTEEDEPEPPKKKAKTAGNRKSLSAIDHDENGVSASEAEADNFQGHTLDAMNKYISKKSWEDLIENIETVEEADDHSLMVYYTAFDGAKGLSTSKLLAQKAPQKLIEFYESHLRWKQQASSS